MSAHGVLPSQVRSVAEARRLFHHYHTGAIIAQEMLEQAGLLILHQRPTVADCLEMLASPLSEATREKVAEEVFRSADYFAKNDRNKDRVHDAVMHIFMHVSAYRSQAAKWLLDHPTVGCVHLFEIIRHDSLHRFDALSRFLEHNEAVLWFEEMLFVDDSVHETVWPLYIASNPPLGHKCSSGSVSGLVKVAREFPHRREAIFHHVASRNNNDQALRFLAEVVPELKERCSAMISCGV
jgi:hypothetical protein